MPFDDVVTVGGTPGEHSEDQEVERALPEINRSITVAFR
jgi:hypothetical protein